MKKLFLFLLVGFFAVVVASCSNIATLQSIQISGQDVEFYAGQEFATGDLKVEAVLSDNSKEDVTELAEVTQNADMNTVGTYTVTVTYKGLSQTYEIAVVADYVVSVVVENLVTEYNIGDEVSFEGAVAEETFASGKTAAADLTTYAVVLADAEGEEYEGAFAKVGKNTVKLSKDEAVYEYEVDVEPNLYASVNEAVAAGVANANKVAEGAGSIVNDEYVNELAYAFGENYSYISSGDGTNYYNLLEDGSIFGLSKELDWEGKEVLTLAYDPAPEHLVGNNFANVFGYAYDVYGVEQLVETFAYVGQLESSLNYRETVPAEASEELVYTFSYEAVLEGNYFFITVEFKLDANTEVISEVKAEMKGYYCEMDYETWELIIPTEFAETPDFTRVVTINQVIGERVAENPYSMDEILVDSFDLVDEEGNKAPTEYAVKAGEQIVLNMANFAPTTAILSVNPVDIEYENDDWTLGISEENGVIMLTPNKARTYVVTISCGSDTQVVTITATEPDPESIESIVYVSVDYGYAVFYDTDYKSNAEMEVGEVLYVGAKVSPDKANQDYTYKFKEETTDATLVVSDYSDWSVPLDSLTFTATAAGTYVIVFTSEKDPTISCELTITVKESTKEPVTLEGIWLASFTHPMTGMKNDFTLELNADGTGKLNCYNSEFVEFTYAVDGNAITYTTTNGWTGSMDGCSVNLNKGTMALTISTEDWGYYPLNFEKEVEGEVEATLAGDWTGTYPHHMNPMLPCNVTMTFNADGTGSGVFNGTALTFEYTDNGGSVSFTNVSSTDITFTIGTYTDGYAELTVFLFVLGNQVQATLTK